MRFVPITSPVFRHTKTIKRKVVSVALLNCRREERRQEDDYSVYEPPPLNCTER